MRTSTQLIPVFVSVAALFAMARSASQDVGYDDGPFLPGAKWRVHDGSRPQPKAVEPGRDGGPPSDAVVLFDGKNLAAWASGDGDAAWKVQDGYMEVNGTGAIRTRQSFGDCQLHIEWQAPETVAGASQGRGNSGVFLMEKYEVQVLDSYENPSYPDGQAAAMYGQYPPAVNAARPPGEWQTYDIMFRAPRFEGDELIEPARATVIHNGVLVHHARAFLGATTHRQLAKYTPHAAQAPLSLQDHGNPVRFRNVWIRELAEPE